MCLLHSSPLLRRALATAAQQDEDVPATTTASKPEGSLAPDPSSSPAWPPRTLPLPVPPLLDIPFVGTPLVGLPFAGVLGVTTWKKWDPSSSSSLGNLHDKRTHDHSQEVKAKSEHSSAQGNEDMPKLLLEAGPYLKQQKGQEPTIPPSSPTRVTADSDDGTVAGSLRSTRDQASSD